LGYPNSWQEFPFGTQPIENAQFPVACPDGELFLGELFLTAIRKGSRDHVIVVLKQGRWTLIEGLPQSSHASYAWRDRRGDLWVVSNLLYRKSALDPKAGWEEVDSEHPGLSGINDVLVNPDGTFFMASATGIVYHPNSAWRVFTRTRDSAGNIIQLKQHMSSMLEDARRRLWMIGKNSLFRFYPDQWEEYPLPSQYITDFNQRDLLVELPGDKILIQLQIAPYFIIFDPETLGMNAYVSKPIQANELSRAISELTSEDPEVDQIAEPADRLPP
jgi:streptogramin lyase